MVWLDYSENGDVNYGGEGPISRDLGRELRDNTRFGSGKPDTELLVSRDTLKLFFRR